MELRFPVEEMTYWAHKYPTEAEGDKKCEMVGQLAAEYGYLTRTGFLTLCDWKTTRTRPLVQSNTDRNIEDHTRSALFSTNINFAPQHLMLLNGVGLPTASAILHFCHTLPFPLIDYRALWSLGIEKYSNAHWSEFVKTCRELSQRSGLSMRDVDRALWQYSKENQPVTEQTRRHNGLLRKNIA